RLFAYSPTELIGHPITELLHPDDRAAFTVGLQKSLAASAHPIPVSCRFRHKLGSWTHCQVTITNLLHQSSPQALVFNILDVTARMGADEFAVLMQSVVHDEQPVRLAVRIVEHFKAPFKVQEREIILRLSMGIAAQSGHEDTAETLMRNADIALNAAKAKGKGRYERYQPQQHAALSDRMDLESDLARAIERRQLVLHYQPSVRLKDGVLLGFEALVRW